VGKKITPGGYEGLGTLAKDEACAKGDPYVTQLSCHNGDGTGEIFEKEKSKGEAQSRKGTRSGSRGSGDSHDIAMSSTSPP